MNLYVGPAASTVRIWRLVLELFVRLLPFLLAVLLPVCDGVLQQQPASLLPSDGVHQFYDALTLAVVLCAAVLIFAAP